MYSLLFPKICVNQSVLFESLKQLTRGTERRLKVERFITKLREITPNFLKILTVHIIIINLLS